MTLNFELILTLILLGIYTYTLVFAHILIARIDKREGVFQEPFTNLSVKFVKSLDATDPEARKAALLLKLNNYTVFVFFALLAWWLTTQSTLL